MSGEREGGDTGRSVIPMCFALFLSTTELGWTSCLDRSRRVGDEDKTRGRERAGRGEIWKWTKEGGTTGIVIVGGIVTLVTREEEKNGRHKRWA